MFLHIVTLALAIFGLSSPVFSQSTDHLKVQLLSQASALTLGQPVTLGVHFIIDPDWHIYWQNPGDAGLATSITWKLPKGFKVGKTLWPIPRVISLPSVTDFGYEKEVLFMVALTPPAHLPPGQRLHFSAHVNWLVCNGSCIPGEATLQLQLPVVSPNQAPITHNPLFSAEERQLPCALPKTWKPSMTLNSKEFLLSFKTHSAFDKAFFFPFIPGQIDNTAAQILRKTASGFTLTLKRSDQLLENVQNLSGLLVLNHQGHLTGYQTMISLSKSN